MNKRELILDFTSLLDVIMIILFFFILFSHLETNEAKAALKAEYAEAEKLLSDAEEKNSAADEAERLASEMFDEAKNAGRRDGMNADSIVKFGRGESIRIKLQMNENGWEMLVYKGNDLLSSIEKSTTYAMAKSLADILSDAGTGTSDTLLCEFVYDGSENGTNSAYEDIKTVFEMTKAKYSHFFYSEIDLSVFEE